jgi:hypothetical protein
VALFLVYPLRLDFNGHWSPHEAIYPYGVVWLAPHADSQEFWWGPLDFVIGNAYIFAGIGFLGYHLFAAARAAIAQPRTVSLRPAPMVRPTSSVNALWVRSGTGRHRAQPAVASAEPAAVGAGSESA